jgi:hypothetical protein
MALYSFAATDQGVYQRIADVVICALGVWAIVAARVMNYQGRWLVFGAGVGLAVLGAIGLLVREHTLERGARMHRFDAIEGGQCVDLEEGVFGHGLHLRILAEAPGPRARERTLRPGPSSPGDAAPRGYIIASRAPLSRRSS